MRIWTSSGAEANVSPLESPPYSLLEKFVAVELAILSNMHEFDQVIETARSPVPSRSVGGTERREREKHFNNTSGQPSYNYYNFACRNSFGDTFGKVERVLAQSWVSFVSIAACRR